MDKLKIKEGVYTCCSYDLEENDGVDEVVDLEENDGDGWLSARRSAASNLHGKKSQNQHY
jgi:hypothetical protein